MTLKNSTRHDIYLVLIVCLVIFVGYLAEIKLKVPEAQAQSYTRDRQTERLVQAEERQAKALEELVRQYKPCNCK